MQISDFSKPTSHPFGMLSGYEHASEKESVLAFILSMCVDAGNFEAVETKHRQPTMVEDGLLEEIGERQYKLTKKSIGLLYSQYGVQADEFVCTNCHKSLAIYWSFCPNCNQAQVIRR